MKFFGWFLFFSLIFVGNVSVAEANSNIKFISVADIHFDPFASCSKSVQRCQSFDLLQSSDYHQWSNLFQSMTQPKASGYKDANYGVLHQSLIHMKTLNETEKPSFVIILGDFLSHDFREDFLLHSKDKSQKRYEEFVYKTFQFICDEFSKTFTGISIYPVIGNNDSYRGDYYVEPNGKFYRDLTHIWLNTLLDKNNRDNFQIYFPSAGYYEINLTNNSSKKLIILNSVAFSSNVLGKEAKSAALAEFQWLEKRLQSAERNNEKVVLAYHIPVGIDVYATVQNNLNKIAQFWKISYTRKFEELLKRYQVVSAILSGHVHIDSFQAITLKQFAGVPVNITPSISPIFGNEPAFKLITLDNSSLEIQNAETYYSPLARDALLHHKKRKHKEIYS